MNEYDNSKLSDFKACPRYYYFAHIRGWSTAGFSAPLAWGRAWHAAQDVLWTTCNVDEAKDAFNESWRSQGGLVAERNISVTLKARTKNTAHQMLNNYFNVRQEFIRKVERLEVERPFKVEFSSTLSYVGRIDKEISVKGEKYIVDHKTTGMATSAGNLMNAYVDSFQTSPQFLGYMFAKKIFTGYADVALVHQKTTNSFTLITIKKNLSDINVWFQDTAFWINLVNTHEKKLEEFKTSDILPVFPRNSNSCVRFNRMCRFANWCNVANPEKIDMPAVFKERFWNPLECESD